MELCELAAYLEKVGLQYMATVGLDGKPKVLFKVFYLKNIRGSLNNLGHVKGLSKRADFAKPKEFEF